VTTVELVAPAAAAAPARGRREASFAVVGVGVMGVGYAVLLGLVAAGWTPHIAYLVQAVVCVELNFVLNRQLTWRDRRGDGSLRGQWTRFHASRLVTVPGNQALFSALTVLGAPVWASNTVCIAVTTVVNYVVAHRWVFAGAAR
jgi:putative flippase GtrA